jgi:hypothetical protein
MATYDELMVYKHAYDLTVEMMQLTKKMDRGFKFTLGERINGACMKMLIAVYRINKSGSDRERFFASGREQVEYVRLLLRLTKDLGLITLRRFSALNEYVESISKQMTAWHNDMRKRNGGGAATQQRIF